MFEPMITKSYGYFIHFDEGSSVPKSPPYDSNPFCGVDQAIILRRLPDHEVRIRGYYCAEREEETLGKERAALVQSYILEHDNVSKRPHHVSWHALPFSERLSAMEIEEAVGKEWGKYVASRIESSILEHGYRPPCTRVEVRFCNPKSAERAE